MDSVYFEYLEGEDRKAYIAEASLNNEFERLSTLFEMTELKHQQSIRDAELKVLVESGTYDDLEYLLEAEAAETGEQKQGILSKILDVISSIFSSIRNAISSFFSKNVEPDKMVEVDNQTIADHEVIKKIQAAWNAVETNFKAGNYVEAAKAAGKIVLPAAAAAAGGAAAGAVVATGVKQMKAQDVSNMIKDAEGLSNKVNVLVDFAKSVVGKIAENVSGDAKKVFDKVKSIGDWIKKHISALISKVTGAVSDVADKVTGNDKKGPNNKYTGTTKKDVSDRMKDMTASHGNVVSRKVGGVEYFIDKKTGKIAVKNGSSFGDVPAGAKIPGMIQKLADQFKSNVKGESVELDENYKIISESEDSIIIEYTEPDTEEVMESENAPELEEGSEDTTNVEEVQESANEEISTEESIFGAVLEESAKEYSEKQDVFEEELNDLRSMFSEFDGLDD